MALAPSIKIRYTLTPRWSFKKNQRWRNVLKFRVTCIPVNLYFNIIQRYSKMIVKRTVVIQHPWIWIVSLIFFVQVSLIHKSNESTNHNRFSIHTSINNNAMRKFSNQLLFSSWNLPIDPIDLRMLEKPQNCHIFLNNFQNVPFKDTYPPMLIWRLVRARIIDENVHPEELDIMQSKEQLTWWKDGIGNQSGHAITDCLLFNQTGV